LACTKGLLEVGGDCAGSTIEKAFIGSAMFLSDATLISVNLVRSDILCLTQGSKSWHLIRLLRLREYGFDYWIERRKG
jgi:hypothetical protein